MGELQLYRPVHQTGETATEPDGKTIYSYQFSPASSTGCVVVSSENRWASGHISFNLRTHTMESTIAERQKPLTQLQLVTRAVAALLVDCGVKMGNIPSGYPEVSMMTSEIMRHDPIPHTDLKQGDYYLCTSVVPSGIRTNVIFKFEGTEERKDRYGLPFTAILYDRHVMRREGVDLLQYMSDNFQPMLTTSYGGLLEGSAAILYDSIDTSQLRPEHFQTAHTEVAFYQATNHDAQKALDLVGPPWPYARVEGVFGT